ncbi:hypothetical protein KI387_040696 [Taxus chinensis]|uniref:PPC domain-containing protein n=1 Tax=Taxus chinensis TaxID=29808 RepID=A0AA38F6A1_TAXCH|nr:hypothetical protein KI387_040696 [Taxus chinensis]
MANRWWAGNVQMPGVDPGGASGHGPGPGHGHTAGHAHEEGQHSGEGGEGNRRPRGRPPGVEEQTQTAHNYHPRQRKCSARAHVLEISNGCDVGESVATFARRRQKGICILSGSGTVTNVTLRQPTAPNAIVTLHGPFRDLVTVGSVPSATGAARSDGLDHLSLRRAGAGGGRERRGSASGFRTRRGNRRNLHERHIRAASSGRGRAADAVAGTERRRRTFASIRRLDGVAGSADAGGSLLKHAYL